MGASFSCQGTLAPQVRKVSVQPPVTGDFPTPWAQTVRGLRGCREHEAGPGAKHRDTGVASTALLEGPRSHLGVRKPRKTWAL